MSSALERYSSVAAQTSNGIEEVTALPMCVDELITDYLFGEKNLFDSLKWWNYLGVTTEASSGLPDTFYEWWNGPDPLDPGGVKKVSDTHLPPVFRPQFVDDVPMTLEALGNLVKKAPQEDPPHFADTEAYRQNIAVVAERGCWVVMRKELLERDKPYNDQVRQIRDYNNTRETGYEEAPSVIDVSTAVFANYILTGERYLGMSDDPGGWSSSRCRETFMKNGKPYQVAVGGFHWDGNLPINRRYTEHDNETLGIAGIRKFEIEEKKEEKKQE